MKNKIDKCRTSYWYQDLADHTFPTIFLRLKQEEVEALANADKKGALPKNIQKRLKHPMASFPGNCFVFTDVVSPTDTERFKLKNGAVYSPASAWRFLVESNKVTQAARDGLVEHICIRPFRRMTKPREFRLFIKNAELKAMSQYWLLRHFRRLEGRKKVYWKKAKEFVKQIAWTLPDNDIVMDIYFTSTGEILIIDFNPWAENTNPLMLKSWDIDWSSELGIKLIEPPKKLGGDISVSF